MDYAALLSRFEVLFREICYDRLLSAAHENLPIVLEFAEIEKFDAELCDALVETPDECFRAAEEAIRNVNVGGEDAPRTILRVRGLPASDVVPIRDLRSKHIGRFVAVDGIIKQASEVRPEITAATFECKACGQRITLLQEDPHLQTPFSCECGNRRGFDLVIRKLIDIQRVELEETPEKLEGGAQPRKVGVFLRDDLVDPKFQKKVVPGAKVQVTGILNDAPLKIELGKETKRRDIYVDANYLEPIEIEFEDITITPEDEKKIKELAGNKKIYDLLVQSIAPSIYGYEEVKLAVALQLFGGVRKTRPDKMVTRGDIHILLVGDPGSGKCVSGDTKIVLADGSVTTIERSVNEVLGNETKTLAGEYYKKTNHDIFSMNRDGKIETMKANAVWKRSVPDSLYRIKTYCGRSITATAEHPFFVSENATIVARTASTLTEKDFIATPSRLDIKGSPQRINSDIKRTPARNAVHIKVPETMNEDFARFTGYLVGDGHAYFTKTSAMISLTNNNEELLYDFSNLLSSLFGVNSTKRESHKGKTAKEVYAGNIELGTLLKHIDATLFERAKYKRIPSIIMKSPNSVLREFVRSYFECEAHVDAKKRVIEIQSASKDLIEDVQVALLRFGIVSQINSGMKCATNTVEKIMREYWRLSISGEMAGIFNKEIGLISKEKSDKLKTIFQKKIKHNTNIHVIPCDVDLLRYLRKLLEMNQKDFGISRSTYEHYEVGDRNPPKENLLKVVQAFEKKFAEIENRLNENEKEFAYVKIKQLRLLSESDVFWDRVVKVERIKPADEWVYDLQVDGVHNFVANNMFIHNSQMLKYVSQLAPKARYVVGKSASGAGLCVAPDSLILNDNGFREISEFVEKNFDETKTIEELPNAFSNRYDGKAIALSGNLKLSESEVNRIWRIKAPDRMIKTVVQSGKELCLTENTSLIRIKEGKIEWVRAKDLSEGDFVACARTLPGGNMNYFPAIKLLAQNKNIRIKNDVSDKFIEITDALVKKYGSIQNIAKYIGAPRDRLYLWRTKEYYHGIPLHVFLGLGKEAGKSPDELANEVKELFLRNGKNIRLPENIVDKDIAYLAGLMIGDGDTQLTKDRVSMRLCGADAELLNKAKEILSEKFGVTALEVNDGKRVPNIRFSFIPVYLILKAFGLSSNKEENTLSHFATEMPNEVLAALLSGLFDTDGFVSKSESPSIGISTISGNLAKNIQLSLLKFGIHSKMRERKVAGRVSVGKTMNGRPIVSRHNQYYVELSGKENLELFREKVGFRLERKIKTLNEIIERIPKANTNVDVIPEINAELDRIMREEKGMARKTQYLARSNISRKKLKSILSDKRNEFLGTLADSDVFWERIVKKEEFKPEYKFVYDFSVRKHHNFIANGFFVHNTATVVKDEFMRGWALEAGALVLANNGMCAIDELDKMGKEDRSAMHEVMEQQCYHPDTNIILSGGKSVKIGPFVDNLMKENPRAVYEGKDCQILPVEGIEIQTTDMKKIVHTKVNRVSRHKAPEKMYKISYSNGRNICVTPEHPTFVCSGGKMVEKRADEVRAGMLAPAPMLYRTQPKEKVALEIPERWHSNLKNISFPEVLDAKLARFLGYLASEGHAYRNEKNRYAEIGITNSNMSILDDVKSLYEDVFSITPNILVQNTCAHRNTCEVQILRCPSQLMYEFFELNFPEIVIHSTAKAVPQKIRETTPEIQQEFLRTMFLGDGFVDQQRFGYVTSSYELAKGLQDILLNNNIWSYITEDARPEGTYYKAVVSGKSSMRQFMVSVVSESDTRAEKIKRLVARAETRENSTDIVPGEVVQKLCALLRKYRMLDGYFDSILKKKQNSNRAVVKKYVEELEDKLNRINAETNPKGMRKISAISVEDIARALDVTPSTIYNIEKNKSHAQYEKLFAVVKNIAREKSEKTRSELEDIKNFVFSDMRLINVKSVEAVENHGLKWVYDVTVEPTKTFISEGLVLHNTVTISKANVQATLHARTTILAAANPKFGRFDAYESIPKQIDIPETLMSRFDLIFPVRDIPNREKDKLLVRHILKLHEEPEIQTPPIDSDTLRKYVAYAKANMHPKLTKAAEKEIESFYVGLRGKYSGEGSEVSAVPIGARQLEALIRLSEASAKISLAEKISKEDAQRAIALVTKCLMEVGIDPETGKLDIDRLESGTTTTQRNKIKIIISLVGEMQEETPDKAVLISDVIAAAEDQGLEGADEIIQKLKQSGELFEPKGGYIRKV